MEETALRSMVFAGRRRAWHLSLHSALRITLPVLLVGLILTAGLQAKAAGFHQITLTGSSAGVWYPSDSSPHPYRIGPFETKVAVDAPVRAGRHPIIIFSHGNGGRYRNHYLTAQAMADAGFVVIAPNHQADYLVGGRKTAAALKHRVLELADALSRLRSDPLISQHLSDGPVHGMGYSLGGATVLLAAGAAFDLEIIKKHCEVNAAQDAEFCGDSDAVYNTDLQDTPDQFQAPTIIDGNLFLVAPIGQGVAASDKIKNRDIAIIAIKGDKISQPRFQARYLQQALAATNKVTYTELPGHHFAFIAPFPKWLTEQEDIPVAKDPPGFDRPAFITAVNSAALSAFGKD